jgi:putative ABC transport system substrate-binding protein
MFPGLKTVGVAWNPAEDNSRVFTEAARVAARQLGLELQEANAENSAAVREAVDSLVARGVQAIWVGGDNTVLSAIDGVVASAKKGRIPVFTINPGNPRRGTLFDMGPNFYEVGRVTGLLAAQVLRGLDPATVPMKNFWPKRLDINTLALQGLKDDWSVPRDLRDGATVLLDERGLHQQKAEKKLTLTEALGIAVPPPRKSSPSRS